MVTTEIEYRIAGFFEGENFHESTAIRENFTLEIFEFPFQTPVQTCLKIL